MSKRLRPKPKQKDIRIVTPNDLGTAELRTHGNWRALDMPVIGRRVMREPVYERLFLDGKITADAWQAGFDYARDVGVAAGARGGDYIYDRIDGCSGPEPAEIILQATTRLRWANERLGRLVRIIYVVCVDCVSMREVARMCYGDDGGAARERAEVLVIEGLGRLVR